MPTFPTTIVTPFTSSTQDVALVGPFEVAGVLYVFPVLRVADVAPPFSHGVMNCYKSTDAGATWTQIGGNSDSIRNNPSCSCAVLVGTKVFIVAPGSAIVGGSIALQVIAFDTVVETFASGVVTTNRYFSFPSGFAEITAAYRSSDGKLVIAALMDGDPNPTRVGYFLYDVNANTFGAWVPCGYIGANVEDWGVAFTLRGNGMMHFLFYVANGADGIWQQSLSDANALGTLQQIDPGVITTPLMASVESSTVVVGMLNVDGVTIQVFTGTSADPIVFAETDSIFPGSIFDTPTVVRSGTVNYIITMGDQGSGRELCYAQDSGSGYGSYTTLSVHNYLRPFTNSLTSYTWGAMLSGSLFFFGFGAIVPPAGGSFIQKMNVPQPTNLPDPNILCHYAQQLRCVFFDHQLYEIQPTKGVYCAIKQQ